MKWLILSLLCGLAFDAMAGAYAAQYAAHLLSIAAEAIP